MANQRPARVFIKKHQGVYHVERIAYANSARTGWVFISGVGGPSYASIRALKAVETPSLLGAGYFPVTYRS